MINEKRMEAFEAVYAELHDVLPDAVKLHRFKTEDSYSLPGLAHDYRMYCAALDSVVVELPEVRNFYGASSECEEGYEAYEVIEAIEAAGVKVKS